MEKMIKKYKILREIGKGGMGIVYKALDTESQKAVALKVLPSSMVDRSSVERFNREIQAMARLKHENLVEIFDYGMTEGQHYYVMEFVDGESLKSIIKKEGGLSLEAGLKIIVKIADALSYIHKEGIVHRDIKPGNIMISQQGQIKLMDFGLVQMPEATKVTVQGSAVGTAEYMSPEQIYGEDIDSRSDIYSLGVTMFETLVGKPPFEGETHQAVLMKHKYDTPPSLQVIKSDIPSEIDRIANKAMTKDVAMRYQKIREMIDDINKFKGVKSIPAAEEKRALRVNGAADKPKKNILPSLLAFLIILGLAGGLYYFKDQIMRTYIYVKRQINLPFLKSSDEIVREATYSLKDIGRADKHYQLGQKYASKNNLSQAVEEYKAAIAIISNDGLYYKALAESYEKLGNRDLAVVAWNDLLKHDHSGSFAEEAIQHLDQYK